MTMAAVLALAAGVFLVRLAGPVMRSRIQVTERTELLMKRGAIVVLAALVVTGALIADGGFAGWALPAGVAVGGVLAWRRAPIIVVVGAAAAPTALLRLGGIA
jgi:branched-subunit amino acid transport protein